MRFFIRERIRVWRRRGLLLGIVLTAFFLAVTGCKRSYTPKPHGYFRITFPEKNYVRYEGPCPYTFEYPVYARVVKDHEPDAEPCWLNVEFPQFHGRLHLTYKNIEDNLGQMLEDTYSLAYKHTVKADAIHERAFTDTARKVYGIFYDIRGNAASNVQFYLTDSTRHYLRGAFYFNLVPNKDSLAPVIRFISQDIIHMIETFSWE